MSDSWLKKRAQEAVSNLETEWDGPNQVLDRKQVAEAIEAVAREFAREALARYSYEQDAGDTGRPSPIEWHRRVYEQNFTEAIAAAEREEP